ncbi:Leucine-rich repeats and WD repeat domain-containing protein 1 [Clonorchis sinensis]|uniref:Leucine-rich repeats and WD repeat domain-containing protein 1 n=1 Tax=Clonorchis sinensis TaxID=79923 RepID=A0A8T1MS46_CLOSI|nr:Leucine-rich repeats and WD repeat domain-containing protein 1 [Clonorchis sinensis]
MDDASLNTLGRQSSEIDNLIIAAAAASGEQGNETDIASEGISQLEPQDVHNKPGFWRPVILQSEHLQAIRNAAKMVCESRENRPFQPEPYSRKQGSELAYREMTDLMDFRGESDRPDRVDLMRKHSMIFRPSGPNSRALTLYEQAVNEAAAQIACQFPAAIYHKRELAILAKQAVRLTGFEFPNARSGYYPPGSIVPNKVGIEDSSDYSDQPMSLPVPIPPAHAAPASASMLLQKSGLQQRGHSHGKGHSPDVVQIRLQGDYPVGESIPHDMFSSVAGNPYYLDTMGGVGDGTPATITTYGGSGMMAFEDEIATSGLDSSELVQLLGGSQAIAQLSDHQLEELGRAQFTVVDPRVDSEMANCPLSLSVEEDDRPLDEAEILRVTRASCLERVRILAVPACGYTSINATHLARCVNLLELDLSENALRVFPRRLHLPRLQRLGLTGNRFIHLPLVEQFPQLRRLTMDDKLKQLLNPQMLAYFCPKLKLINGQYFEELCTDFTVRIIQEARAIVEPHVRSKWEADFADHYHSVQSRAERMQLIEHIVQHLRERNLLVDESLNKYKDLMLFQFVDSYLRSKLFDASDAELMTSVTTVGSKRDRIMTAHSATTDPTEFATEDLLAEPAVSDYETSPRSAPIPSQRPASMVVDIETEDNLDDDEEEREAEARAANERALFEATDEILGSNLPDPALLAGATGQVQTTLVMDAMGRLHQQQVLVAPAGYQTNGLLSGTMQTGGQSNQFHLARSLRQGRSIVMTVVRPRGVSGRPVAEFLPGELRNKDYVKGYMASEIYKKAVKDTLGQKTTPKKRQGVNRPRKIDASWPCSPSSGMNPLGEVNTEGGKKSGSLASKSRHLKNDYDMPDIQHQGSGTNLPPRPKKRKTMGGHRSLRDLCSESSYGTTDIYGTVNVGMGPRSDATPIDYDPLHFIRCHAKDNDAGDSETKVWRCLFEPNPQRPDETTHVVATCGGECVCLINCETGKVMKRFKHMEEEFYTIAWTTVEVECGKATNILAAAGRMREIRLLHPEQLVCYAEMKGHTEDITAMIFHQTQPTILFSGDSKASVLVWDIGIPSVPDYKTRYQLLMRLRCPRLDVNPVLNLVFLPHYAYLIAGCEDGLFAWKVTDLRLEKREREPDMELKLDFDHEVCIDALSQLSDNALVIKVVESGEIMVFDFASVLERRKGLQRVVPIEMRGHLLWQKTDEIYINVSVRQNLGAVLCGDNEGSIWIYDLDPYLDDLHASSRKKFHVKPIKILEWPECSVQGNRDEDQQLKESITSGFRNPVVNSVEMSSDGYYLAAVTDNNLVCIWRYAPPLQQQQQFSQIQAQPVTTQHVNAMRLVAKTTTASSARDNSLDSVLGTAVSSSNAEGTMLEHLGLGAQLTG